MLIRIFLIVAILAGLAAAALNFLQVKEAVTTLQTNLENTKNELDTTKSNLAKTKKELEKTAGDLKKTQTELGDTKKELDLTRNEAAKQKKQIAELTSEVNRVKVERDDAAAEIAAWKALGLSVDQIKGVLAQLKDVRKERDGLNETLAKWMTMHKSATNELGRYVNPEDQKVPLPPGLKGKVVVVDPKFDFIVLDVGESQGVLERGEMLVSREGKLVAKVRVWTVERQRCVANVLPGWKLADVMEGDQVVPAL
jgi:uncharacterized membrane-anchored protein YhcB (DUF1043 family)